MNRHIAVVLILTLLAQSLLPGVAMALAAEPPSPRTLLICTGDGVKEVALDPSGIDAGPQGSQLPHAQDCWPWCVLCCGCPLLCCDRLGVRVVYPPSMSFRLWPEAARPITVRAPPAHRSRAPPVSS